MKIAIVGTQGLPNIYGGFETLTDFLVKNLSGDYEITIWCSSTIYKKKLTEYNGANLKYLPFSANGFQSIIYDVVSLILSINYDRILVLGASGGIIFPFLFCIKKKLILNFGGLDWQRSKWSQITRNFLKLSEKLAVKNSGVLVADNKGIQSYIKNEYGLDSVLIEYGGDQAFPVEINPLYIKKYPFLNHEYVFSLARIQPDNNIDLILESFNEIDLYPLVFVGNWESSDYGKKLKKKFINHTDIILIDAIYDQTELNLLRSNCSIYIHGHSAGGTNPALVEAMYLGLPILAFSNGFNENTTENEAFYFSDKLQLVNLVKGVSKTRLTEVGAKMKEIAESRYKWSIISLKYKELFDAD